MLSCRRRTSKRRLSIRDTGLARGWNFIALLRTAAHNELPQLQATAIYLDEFQARGYCL
jgi:hypothetical protein